MDNDKRNREMPPQPQSDAGLGKNAQARAEWASKRSSTSSTSASTTSTGTVPTTTTTIASQAIAKHGLRRQSQGIMANCGTAMRNASAPPQPLLDTTTPVGAMPMDGARVQEMNPTSEEDDEEEYVLPRRNSGDYREDQERSRSEFLVEATLVTTEAAGERQEPQDMEQQQPSHPPSAELAKVVEAEQLYFGFSFRQLLLLGGCLVVVAVAAVLLASVLPSNTNDNNTDSSSSAQATTTSSSTTPNPTATPLPTLEAIRQRGELRCGVWDESIAFVQASGLLLGDHEQLDVLLCHALAAAILGNSSAVHIVETSQENTFAMLSNGAVDLLASHLETSMQVDVYETENGSTTHPTGFTFSVPYLYVDIYWAGNKTFVDCIEDNFNTKEECESLKACMNKDNQRAAFVAASIPESFLYGITSFVELVTGFRDGECNVFVSEGTQVIPDELKLLGYTGEYYQSAKPFVIDVGTVATRDDDPEWSDFVNIILMGLMAAEQANVSRNNAAQMLLADVLGEELERAVAAVGNYAEVFEHGWEPIIQGRSGINMLNNGTSGLMLTLPLGNIHHGGPGPTHGGTLEAIRYRQSGKLRCGVRLGYQGFAGYDAAGDRYTGLNIDMCAALAASLFQSTPDSVQYVDVEDEVNGYHMLQSGEVDVLAGFTWTIQNDYLEPGTGEGYSFSQPYFYQPMEALYNMSFTLDENLCLVTRQDDPQFSSFVFWVVASTWCAEEIGVTEADYNDMPDVNLFGHTYSKMFRDAIYAVGNYGEIWERNLEALIPRGGRNTLNSVQEPGPVHYVPPGFFH